jgi:hypothetical protein
MISLNSFKNFFYTNTLLIFLGFFQFQITTYSHNLNINFFIILLTYLTRNYFLINLIDYNLQNKENINNNLTIENYKHEFNLAVVSSTVIETITYILIRTYMFPNILPEVGPPF